MVARKADINEWHFAHAGHADQKPDEPCEYSFFVSVRHMVHQILGDIESMATPEMTGEVAISGYRFGSTLREPYTVTGERNIKVQAVGAQPQYQGTPVDAIVHGNEFPFVVYLIHPERSVPAELKDQVQEDFGLLAVDLVWVRQQFEKNWNSGDRQPYGLLLRRYLEDSLQGKSWEAHPDAVVAREAALERANQRLEAEKRKFEERLAAQAEYQTCVRRRMDTPPLTQAEPIIEREDPSPRAFKPIQKVRTAIAQQAADQRAERLGLARYRCYKCIRSWAGRSDVCCGCGSNKDVEQVPF